MYKEKKIGIVIPCYKVKKKILKVLKKIPNYIDVIVLVDDFCSEKTGEYVQKNKPNNINLHIKFNKKNLGVGGAVLVGYKTLLTENCDILVKIDGDDQMNQLDIVKLLNPIIKYNYDYTKGNRYLNENNLKKMPKLRLYGNYLISLFSKITTGYFNIFDFLNGYTAIKSTCIKNLIKKNNIENNFFFETDILFKLNTIKATVKDVDVLIDYPKNNKSNFFPQKQFFIFFYKNIQKYILRVYEKYFLTNLYFETFIYINLFTSLFINIIYNLGGIMAGLYKQDINVTLFLHLVVSILISVYIDIKNNPNLKM